MEIITTKLNEIKGFLGYESAWKIIQTGNYNQFLTYEGIKSVIGPLIPFLVIFEFLMGLLYKNRMQKCINSISLSMCSIDLFLELFQLAY